MVLKRIFKVTVVGYCTHIVTLYLEEEIYFTIEVFYCFNMAECSWISMVCTSQKNGLQIIVNGPQN